MIVRERAAQTLQMDHLLLLMLLMVQSYVVVMPKPISSSSEYSFTDAAQSNNTSVAKRAMPAKDGRIAHFIMSESQNQPRGSKSRDGRLCHNRNQHQLFVSSESSSVQTGVRRQRKRREETYTDDPLILPITRTGGAVSDGNGIATNKTLVANLDAMTTGALVTIICAVVLLCVTTAFLLVGLAKQKGILCFRKKTSDESPLLPGGSIGRSSVASQRSDWASSVQTSTRPSSASVATSTAASTVGGPTSVDRRSSQTKQLDSAVSSRTELSRKLSQTLSQQQ